MSKKNGVEDDLECIVPERKIEFTPKMLQSHKAGENDLPNYKETA